MIWLIVIGWLICAALAYSILRAVKMREREYYRGPKWTNQDKALALFMAFTLSPMALLIAFFMWLEVCRWGQKEAKW